MEAEIRLNIRIADRTYTVYARPDVEPKVRAAAQMIQQEIDSLRERHLCDMVEILTLITLDQTIKNLSNA